MTDGKRGFVPGCPAREIETGDVCRVVRTPMLCVLHVNGDSVPGYLYEFGGGGQLHGRTQDDFESRFERV